MTTFDDAFAYTIGNEGKYSNNPHDHGGPTKYGITQADLSQWLGHPASIDDVKNMPLEMAKAIYDERYWGAIDCEGVSSPGVAIALFDIGVVRGVRIPQVYAQQICNENGKQLVVDGHIGPKTLAAINSLDPKSFIRRFADLSEAGFRAIVAQNPSQSVFLNGWVNRARRLLTLLPKA